jgi:Protein of unknown function (DUF3572)
MTPDAAHAIAEEALIWLAGRPEALGRFLAESGAGPGELRRRAAEPEFLGFVLDFLLSDEALARNFSAEADLAPEKLVRARASLPGGEIPNWT